MKNLKKTYISIARINFRIEEESRESTEYGGENYQRNGARPVENTVGTAFYHFIEIFFWFLGVKKQVSKWLITL